MIKHHESRIVYENPRPPVHRRHDCFPVMGMLNPHEILVMFMQAEAFEVPSGMALPASTASGCVMRSPPSCGRETGRCQQ